MSNKLKAIVYTILLLISIPATISLMLWKPITAWVILGILTTISILCLIYVIYLAILDAIED